MDPEVCWAGFLRHLKLCTTCQAHRGDLKAGAPLAMECPEGWALLREWDEAKKRARELEWDDAVRDCVEGI